jgi:hypothetical protein
LNAPTDSRGELNNACRTQAHQFLCQFGCYQARVSVPGVYRISDSYGLNPAEFTIAERLWEQGYATACVGKWHPGDQPAFLPTRQGFDEYFGIPYSKDMQHRPASGGPAAVPLLLNETVQEFVTEDRQSSLIERFTNQAVNFITANKTHPFFLYFPHLECRADSSTHCDSTSSTQKFWSSSPVTMDHGLQKVLLCATVCDANCGCC